MTFALLACTVNPVEPAGVAAVVVIVSVELFDVSPAANVNELGLNDAVAPAGNAVGTLRFTVKVVPVAPLRFTVSAYVALPAVPDDNAPVCEPTVTVPTRFATTLSVRLADEPGPLPWHPAPLFVPVTAKV
jgi:hypothetical protein